MLNIHTGPVWRSTNGKPITISAYAMTVRNTAKKAQISHRVSTHQLRHGFATAMMENGTDIRTLAEMMGHNSIQTTERYLHVTDSRMKEQHNLHAPQVVDATFPQFNTGAQAEWWRR
jgi:site-specific recombinase XerD